MGLSQIIDSYQHNISNFYSFPLGAFIPGRLKKLSEKYYKVVEESDSLALAKRSLELVRVLNYAKKYIGSDRWQEPNGYDNNIAPVGFKGVSVSVILPGPRFSNKFFQMIEDNSADIVAEEDLNRLSMAFHIKYAGHEIILGGDATNSCWLEHRNYCDKRGVEVRSNIAKLPHHGSEKDCTEKNLSHMFLDDEAGVERIACISANGKSHPHPDTIKILSEKSIKPYCTNLSDFCGANIQELVTSPEFDAEFNHFLCLISEPGHKSIQPCQGDVAISITATGALEISSQYQNDCPYRGDLDGIFS
jgi:hypothetical protein